MPRETTTYPARSLQLRHLVCVALLVIVPGRLLNDRVHAAEQAADPPALRVPVRAYAGPLTDPLPDRAIRRFGTERFRHGPHIVGLSVSSDDKFAVAFGRSSGSNQFLASSGVYDLRNGRRLAKLPGRFNSIEAVAISPDGKTVATKHNRGINLHDPKTGAEVDNIKVWTGNPRSVTYWLTFSPDGSKIAMSTAWQEIQIIDVTAKKVLHTFAHDKTVYAGAFSPDGKLFAAGDNYSVRLWDVGTGKYIRLFPNGNARMSTLAFSPDGKNLAGGGGAVAGGGGDGQLRLWDVATGEVRHLFEKNGDRIRSVVFAHDGKTIASAGDTIRRYDVATKKERLRISARRATNLHFSATDDVLTASIEGAIHRWETKTGKLLTPESPNSAVNQIHLANNGRTLVTHDQAGVVHLWDRATGKHLRQMEMDSRREFAVSSDGRYLVLSKEDKYQWNYVPDGPKVMLYDLESDEFVERFAEFEGFSHDKEPTSDGKTLVTVDHWNGNVRLWDVATGKKCGSFVAFRKDAPNKSHLITGSVLSPDGKTLAVAYRRRNYPDGTFDPFSLRLWDVTTGREFVQLEGHSANVNGSAFSPDGRFLASCSESPAGSRREVKDLLISDLKSGRQLRLSDGEPAAAFRVAFSPDGRMLASGSLDGTVRVWEVASWTLRTKFQAHRDHISALHFAQNGTLFTGSFDSTVLAWNVRPDKSDKDLPLPHAWTKLLDPKAETAYAVQGRLLATPQETVALLAEHLRPVAKVDPERVAKQLANLDSDDFATREAAARTLRQFGHQIETTLREALAKTTSIEVRGRLQGLLSQLEPTVSPPAELRTLRAVEVLEWLATPSARELLSNLAKGEPDALLTRTAASAIGRLRARGE